jgi:hypothetical protein
MPPCPRSRRDGCGCRLYLLSNAEDQKKTIATCPRKARVSEINKEDDPRPNTALAKSPLGGSERCEVLMIMKSAECIQTARKAHVVLRSRAAGTRSDDQSYAAYRTLKTALDELWAAAEQHRETKQIRKAIGKLTVDAEFFAGLNDGEGFRDATEVWQQYTYLEHAIGLGDSK